MKICSICKQEKFLDEFHKSKAHKKGVSHEKVRGIDFKLLKQAAMVNGPTKIALTFLDHYDPKMNNVVDPFFITEKTRELIRKVDEVTSSKTVMLETGKLYNSIIDL